MAFKRSDLTKVRDEQEPKLEGLSTDQRLVRLAASNH
jgi:hypothetical protein